MAVVQDTYLDAPLTGYAGQVANGETSNRLSRTVEDTGGIGFGVAAFRGSGDNGITATPAANTFMGVTIADHGVANVAGQTADEYQQYDTAALLDEGCIFVVAGEAVTDGAAAYVTPAGAWVDTSTDNVAVPAKFDQTVASGAIVRLRVVR